MTDFASFGRDDFMNDPQIQVAVIDLLGTIGEAGRALSETFREQHPEVPWKQIIGVQNFTIHADWKFSIERIWQILENDLTPLRPQIEAILIEFDSDSES
ncbi:MAG: DUF86 domain-containing protein [Anaerolineae bacterium]|nr:DUF86 domain-containing protein [Anaerolineae bacterium]